MFYYKDQNNKVHAISSKEYEAMLPSGCVEITEAEATSLNNPPETDAEAAQRLLAVVEQHMDAVAAERNYDNRYTCAVRAGYPNQWQAEGTAFGEWMDACYAHLYQVQADVLAGSRAIPSEVDLIAELPAMVWP